MNTKIMPPAGLIFSNWIFGAPLTIQKGVKKAKSITRNHIERARKLFVDVSRSVKHLQEFEEKMLK